MRQGIKEKDIRDFEKYAKKLSEVIERIRKYKPEVNAFLSCGCTSDLNLMSCDFRMYNKGKDQQNLIVTSVEMIGFDGGDF